MIIAAALIGFAIGLWVATWVGRTAPDPGPSKELVERLKRSEEFSPELRAKVIEAVVAGRDPMVPVLMNLSETLFRVVQNFIDEMDDIDPRKAEMQEDFTEARLYALRGRVQWETRR